MTPTDIWFCNPVLVGSKAYKLLKELLVAVFILCKYTVVSEKRGHGRPRIPTGYKYIKLDNNEHI